MKFELTNKAAIIVLTLFFISLILSWNFKNPEYPRLLGLLYLCQGIILGILSAPHIKIWIFKKHIDEKNPSST